MNGIAPGYVVTDIAAHVISDPVTYQSILNRIPAGRWAQTEDLKGSIVYLTAAASDYVNGEIPTIDGGWMAR